MRSMLSFVLAAGLLFSPVVTFAADYGSQSSQTQQVPPVAQPLVREGDFAIKLAAELGLGTPEQTEEETAERLLADAGIVPLNGWISDYPVTAEIVGQLKDAIVRADENGKLPVSKERAEEAVTRLASGLDLPLPAPATGEAGQPTEEQKAAADGYYAEQGPPVITYYAPPMDYAYLYDWVPYPAVWHGFWFPGFFICRDFTTVVTVAPFPHHFHRAIVTDHFFDPVSRRAARVDHVFRNDHGVIRPQTLLRSDTGRTFRNASEFRRHFRDEGSIGSPGRPVVPGGERERQRSFAQNSINRGRAAPGGHGSSGTFSGPGSSGVRPHGIAPTQPGSLGRQSSRGPGLGAPSAPQSNTRRSPGTSLSPGSSGIRPHGIAPTQPGSLGRQSSRGPALGAPSAPQSNTQRSPGTSLNPGSSGIRPHGIAPTQPGSLGRQSSRGPALGAPSAPQSNMRRSPGTSLGPGSSGIRPHGIAPTQQGSFGRQSSRGSQFGVPSVPQSNGARQFAGPGSSPPASQAPMRTYQGGSSQGRGGAGFGHGPGGGMRR